MTRIVFIAAVVAIAASISGCGISDPDAIAPPSTSPPLAAQPASSHQVAAGQGWQRQRELLARFARVWMTYTFTTLPTQQRRLAALATGRLARQLRRSAERDLQAQYIHLASVRSSGNVEAIAVSARRTTIVVTREALTTNGDTQTSWNVFLATVADTAAGLRVATWTPVSDG